MGACALGPSGIGGFGQPIQLGEARSLHEHGEKAGILAGERARFVQERTHLVLKCRQFPGGDVGKLAGSGGFIRGAGKFFGKEADLLEVVIGFLRNEANFICGRSPWCAVSRQHPGIVIHVIEDTTPVRSTAYIPRPWKKTAIVSGRSETQADPAIRTRTVRRIRSIASAE